MSFSFLAGLEAWSLIFVSVLQVSGLIQKYRWLDAVYASESSMG